MPIQAIISAFGIVFVTEIGDKTMLTTMCLSAQYRRPLVILSASMLALAIASIIAVVVGVVLAAALPIDLILLVSASLFIGLGIFSLVKDNPEADDCKQPTTFLSMVSVVLASELGDKSQIAILALAAQSTFPILVFLGAIAGFLIVNLIGAYAGDQAASRLPVDTITKVTGIVFIAFGILILAGFL
jgi:putative Ca2+/H+ antiporter (TMEM165/GDT1 family)